MSSPYVGEIRMFGGNFAPAGWAFCNGQLMAISENDALFNLIGTTYGGDGQSTFALPNLQSRVPIHMGQGPGLSNYIIGEASGTETVTLTTQQIPAHGHPAAATSVDGSDAAPTNNFWANWGSAQYSDQPFTSQMAATALTPVGGSQPHDNMLPFLTINFIISLFGIFPSQN